jgi:Fic family protein
MKAIIKEIEELITLLKAKLPFEPETQAKLDKKFRIEFNYHSNHIEGSALTYLETEAFLYPGNTLDTRGYRVIEELLAHDDAFDLIKEWASDENFQLTEKHIKELNQIILVRPYWIETITPDGHITKRLIKGGDYKEFPNSVRLQNGKIFEYASPKDTPIMMGELMEWFKIESQKGKLHPLELAALMHYKFVSIHPFDEGNGRVSRLLMNYILLRHQLPPVIIKTKDKKNYMYALSQADSGNLNAFITYIARQLFWSLNIYINAANNQSITKTDDIDKLIKSLENRFAAKENDGRIKKTLSLVAELYLTKLKLIFDLLLFRHSTFDKLFADNIYYRLTNTSIFKFEHIDYDTIEQTLINAIQSKNVIEYDLEKIALIIGHSGYLQDKLNNFDVDFMVQIKFDDYQFHICEDDKIKMSFSYSEIPSDDEIINIANDIMEEHAIEIVKRASSQ